MAESLLIVTGLFPACSETFVLRHALGMAARGYRVSVLSHGVGEGVGQTTLEEIDRAGVARLYPMRFGACRCGNAVELIRQVFRDPLAVSAMFRPSPLSWHQVLSKRVFRRVLRQVLPGVVHVHHGMHAAALHDEFFETPVVVSWHGFDANVAAARNGSIFDRLFRYPVRHTVNSRFLERRLHALGAPEAAVHIVPMGVDCDFFRPPRIERASGKDEIRLIAVGRLSPEKGQAHLLRAMRILKDAGLSVSLKLLGEGDERQPLRAMVRDMKLEEVVDLPGSCPPAVVLAELQKADIFVYAGVRAPDGAEETQGIALVEAAATALPVVATRIGGVPETVADGEHGALVPPGDAGALAAKLRELIADPGKRRRWGAAGRRRAELHFSLEATLDAFERIYENEKEISGR